VASWKILPVVAWLCAWGPPALAAGEHGDDTNIFNADIGNFVFTLIIFGLVVLVLGKTLWKPLLNVLNEREKTIREALESAKREREQAAKLLADYQARLDQARVEAGALVEEGRRDAAATRQRILEQVHKDTAQLTERARKDIQLASDAAIKDLYDRTAELATDVAGRVLRKQLSPADHTRLVAESITEIRAGGKAKLN